MILKIFDEVEHAWIYYDKIEKFKIVYPYEMKFYLGEVKEQKKDEPENRTIHYYYDEKNNRKLLVRHGSSPDYDGGYIIPNRFIGIIEELELYERLGLINFQQGGTSKECLEKTFVFSRRFSGYLLNDEGKTIERL